MSVETDFRALMLAHAPLVTLVSTRVAQDVMEQGKPPPFVVFTGQHDHTHNLLGEQVEDACTLTVQCWGTTSLQADAVANAVVAALAGAPAQHCVVVLSRSGGYDEDMGFHATILQVEWWA